MNNKCYMKDYLSKNAYIINKGNNKNIDPAIEELEEKLRDKNKLVMVISHDETKETNK